MANPEETLREQLNGLLVWVRKMDRPLPEAIARVVLDARARGVRPKLSTINLDQLQRGERSTVYGWAEMILTQLARAEREKPEIVPELEEEIAKLDPLHTV